MVDLLQFIRALQEQKAKYHSKVVKDTAVSVTLQRIFDVSDLLYIDIWLRIPEIAWSALGFSILFDMPPINFDPIFFDFDVELPKITFELPRDLLADICSLPREQRAGKLPPDVLRSLSNALCPGMTIDDAIDAMCGMYPPDVLATLPDKVTVELPNWAAYCNGIYIIIKWHDILKDYPWLKDVDEFIKENFEVELKHPRKCIYGESAYGECFYDPNEWQNFVKGAALKIAAMYKTRLSVTKTFENIGSVANIDVNTVKHIYNRMALIAEAQAQAFILGYSILGYSPLTPKTEGKPTIKIIDYDGYELEVRFDNLAQLQAGFILGITPLGQGILIPPEDVYKKPTTTLGGVHTTRGSPPAVRMVAYKARKMIASSVYNGWSFGNYARPDERSDWRRSERADQWLEIQTLYALIDNIVEPILERHGVNVYDKRVYKNAVRQLIGFKAKRHAWGFDLFKQMDENTFKQWWLEHWAAQGLDKVILEALYNAVARWLESWRRLKYQLGASLRLRRLRLAGLL